MCILIRSNAEIFTSLSTPPGDAYMAAHDAGVAYARANRQLIAHRFLTGLGARATRTVLDVTHNSVTALQLPASDPRVSLVPRLHVHRKGAAPGDAGPVVIPGSRGTMSYVVVPRDEFPELSGTGRQPQSMEIDPKSKPNPSSSRAHFQI
jgi:RNA-splicing ligase RtcB